ncbi:MAG TPA: hypothetical protein VFA43_03000 [Gemmatimonadaceae bacterium]|nr:hypothetical protein [Gemmatimonadaceae bacterium]
MEISGGESFQRLTFVGVRPSERIGARHDSVQSQCLVEHAPDVHAYFRACQDILDRAGTTEREEPASRVVSVSATPPTVDVGMIQTDHLTDEQLAGGRKFLQALPEAIVKAWAGSDAAGG